MIAGRTGLLRAVVAAAMVVADKGGAETIAVDASDGADDREGRPAKQADFDVSPYRETRSRTKVRDWEQRDRKKRRR